MNLPTVAQRDAQWTFRCGIAIVLATIAGAVGGGLELIAFFAGVTVAVLGFVGKKLIGEMEDPL